MFDVGLWEILLILVLALVIIGPERLPDAARKAGLFVGKARRYIEGVRSEVEQELDVDEFKRMLRNQEVQINELQEQIKSSTDASVLLNAERDISTSDISTTPAQSFYDEDNASDALSDDKLSTSDDKETSSNK